MKNILFGVFVVVTGVIILLFGPGYYHAGRVDRWVGAPTILVGCYILWVAKRARDEQEK